MAARTETFDRIVVQRVTLTRNNSDPVGAEITYEVSTASGRYPATVTFVATGVPANIQTQLNNLYALAETAARQREGL